MGITSLSHVRVANLQELIYKYGNAGIEKASVTITFDNTHQDRICPIGMQDYKEVTVTRQVVRQFLSSLDEGREDQILLERE